MLFRSIQFIESDWKKALAEAKKQNKLIFLDAYATWCGPCRMLKQYTFPDKAVGEFFNENFINIALDMEKGDGPAVARQYQVNAYLPMAMAIWLPIPKVISMQNSCLSLVNSGFRKKQNNFSLIKSI